MEVIIMPDGAREIIGGPRDMLDLMDRYMGGRCREVVEGIPSR